MANTSLTDDDVVAILRKEATNISRTYFGGGFGPLTNGSRSSAPKPNTRFLRNIIRDTDSHNAALKAREEADLRARQRRAKRREQDSSRSTTRHRRDEDRASRSSHTRDRDYRNRSGRSTISNSRHHDEDSSRQKRRRHHDEREAGTQRQNRSHSRTRSPSRKESRGSKEFRSRRHEQPPSREREGSRDTHRRDPDPEPEPDPEPDSDSDSDTLDGGIGPLPPPKVLPRGRGAYKVSSIDSRFGPNYDPAADVEARPADADDEWDKALRAVRDRVKWRKGRADRLLAAGFTDEEVQRFEKGMDERESGEKDASDVRWAKRGEGREWDRGKVLDGDSVDVVPEWGRLSGT